MGSIYSTAAAAAILVRKAHLAKTLPRGMF